MILHLQDSTPLAVRWLRTPTTVRQHRPRQPSARQAPARAGSGAPGEWHWTPGTVTALLLPQ
jgi:hypothetical protein